MNGEAAEYKGRPVLFGLFLLCLCLLLICVSSPLKRWDLTVYDLFSGLLQRPAPADILIVAVDEHSLAVEGRWPWPRRLHARLIDILSRGGAEVIGLDILFAETSTDSRVDDLLLSEAIRKSGRVILPLVNETSRQGEALKLTRPLPLLVEAAAGLGHVDVELDQDGIVRHAFLKAGLGRADIPAFSLAMLKLTAPASEENLPGLRHPEPGSISNGIWVRDYKILIPFAGPPGHFRRISYADVLAPGFDPSVFKDACVFVGVTALGLGDGLPTPVSGNSVSMPGVEFNATLLDTLRNHLAILPMSVAQQVILGWILVLVPVFLYPRFRAGGSLITAALFVLLTLAISFLFLRFFQLWYPPVAVLATTVLGYLLWSWRRLKWTVNELATEKHQAQVTLHSIGDGVLSLDASGRIRYMNPMAESLTGWSTGEAFGRPLQEVVRLSDERQGRDLVPVIQRCLQETRPTTVQVDALLANRDGQEFTVHASAGSIHDEQGRNMGVVLGISDLTETRNMAEQLTFHTTHDTLTGLPNRTLLKDRLEQAIARAGLNNLQVAVFYLDLDYFKKANDMLGHAGADQLLQETASRLQALDHKGMTTVTRLGADEFVVLLEDVADSSQVGLAAKNMLAALQAPFSIEQQNIQLTASIGVSLFPEHGKRAEDLIRHADMAMYQVKESRRNDFQLFSDEMHDWIRERLDMEKELQQALEKDELELFYQPQIRLSDGRLMGVEALLRWESPERGCISPARFIPIAEESDLILAVGQWVLEKACRQAKEWENAGFDPMTMAVNISPRQFLQKNYLDLIVRILEETGMSARYLELEITENTIIQHLEHSSEFIKGFRALGGTISIDDFGTGYSSLSYLKQFPVDHLKIDRFFVRDIAVVPEDAAITKAVITMAHGMNLSVVAEGVETQAQLSLLQDQDCDKVQGYLLAHPMSAREMTSLLERGGVCPVCSGNKPD